MKSIKYIIYYCAVLSLLVTTQVTSASALDNEYTFKLGFKKRY